MEFVTFRKIIKSVNFFLHVGTANELMETRGLFVTCLETFILGKGGALTRDTDLLSCKTDWKSC